MVTSADPAAGPAWRAATARMARETVFMPMSSCDPESPSGMG
jgi:hypothetical protein